MKSKKYCFTLNKSLKHKEHLENFIHMYNCTYGYIIYNLNLYYIFIIYTNNKNMNILLLKKMMLEGIIFYFHPLSQKSSTLQENNVNY